MNALTKAVRRIYFGYITPLEEEFNTFRGKTDRERFIGTREQHTLLAAFLVLRGKGVHFAQPQDREEFQKLVAIVKRCQQEVKNEDLPTRGTDSGK